MQRPPRLIQPSYLRDRFGGDVWDATNEPTARVSEHVLAECEPEEPALPHYLREAVVAQRAQLDLSTCGGGA